jgi:hypothetical protein
MSESVAAAVTEAAPAVAEAPQVVAETPQAAPEQAPIEVTGYGPEARRQARESLRQSMRSRTEAVAEAAPEAQPETQTGAATDAPTPVVDALGRAHDSATGQFIPAANAAVDTPPPAALPLGETPAEAAAAMPQTGRRIDIPVDHPLRQSGLEALGAQTEQEERAIRALLNSHVRRQEVDAAQQQLQAERTERLRLQAQLDAQSRWNNKVLESGDLAKYQALQEVDPDVAAAFLKGKQADMEAEAASEFGKLTEAETQSRAAAAQVAAENRVRGAAVEFASQNWPRELVALPHFGELLAEAEVNTELALGRAQREGRIPADPAAVERFATEVLVEKLKLAVAGDRRGAEIVSHYTRQQAEQAAEQQRQAQAQQQAAAVAEAQRQAQAAAQAAEAQRLLQASQRTANPAGQIPSAVRTGQSTSAEGGVDISTLHGSRLRNHLRNEVRQKAAAYVPR